MRVVLQKLCPKTKKGLRSKVQGLRFEFKVYGFKGFGLRFMVFMVYG